MPETAEDFARIKELVAELRLHMELLRLIARLPELYQSPIEQRSLYPVAQLLATTVAAFAEDPLIEIALTLERLEDAIAPDWASNCSGKNSPTVSGLADHWRWVYQLRFDRCSTFKGTLYGLALWNVLDLP